MAAVSLFGDTNMAAVTSCETQRSKTGRAAEVVDFHDFVRHRLESTAKWFSLKWKISNLPLTGCNLWLGLGENVLALDFGKAEDNLEFWRTTKKNNNRRNWLHLEGLRNSKTRNMFK